MKTVIIIIVIIVIGVLAWLLLGGQSSEEITTNTNTTNTNATTNTTLNINMTNSEPSEDTESMVVTDTMTEEMDEISYDYTGTLLDVTGGTSSGVAKAKYSDDTYMLLVNFGDLPDPTGTDFYEGWIVRNSPLDVISTGRVEKEEGVYKNRYNSGQDLTDHDFYVLTIEPDDGNPAPADHVLEGTLSK